MDRYTARKLTKLKRKSQSCKVFEIKLNYSHLSKISLNHLHKLFSEAKWFYNYCLSHKDVNDANTTIKSVPVKIKDSFENRTFSALSAQMKQGIKTRLFNSLSALKILKQKGYKIGRLKFKSQINSIPLKQFKVTFDIDQKSKRIRIQGLKSWIKVNGLEQIKENYEIANATLIKKSNDFYLHITTFSTKEEKIIPDASIGIDFGCQTQLSFSNGIKVEFQIPVSKRLRRLDRKIMRNKNKNSKKRKQNQIKRQQEYNHITNKKKDIKHKIVNAITTNFKYVCFQDESIHAWHSGNHGKKIQNSGIGGIISDLKNKSVTPLEVNKFFPSTQLCPNCGVKNKLSLEDRIYNCSCGYKEDRDIKSAICLEKEGMNKIPVDSRELTARENSASDFFKLLSKIDNIKVVKLESMN